MAKPRYRVERAEVVELSSQTRAVITDGVVYIHKGTSTTTLTLREAEVLAGVVGTGDGVPEAIVSAMLKVHDPVAA